MVKEQKENNNGGNETYIRQIKISPKYKKEPVKTMDLTK